MRCARGGRGVMPAMLPHWKTGLVGGALSVAVLRHRDLGDDGRADRLVAALRETSVLFGALIAVVFLKEPLRAGARRRGADDRLRAGADPAGLGLSHRPHPEEPRAASRRVGPGLRPILRTAGFAPPQDEVGCAKLAVNDWRRRRFRCSPKRSRPPRRRARSSRSASSPTSRSACSTSTASCAANTCRARNSLGAR